MQGSSGWVPYRGQETPPASNGDLRRAKMSDSMRRTSRPSDFQSEGNYQNMRFQTIYGDISAIATLAKRNWLQNTLMPAAETYLSQLLRVVPVSGKLYVPRTCDSMYSSSGKCAAAASDAQETCGTSASGYGAVSPNDLGSFTTYDGFGNPSTIAAGSGGYQNKDMILYVTAKASANCNGGYEGNTLAYAGACAYDQYDRPIAGYINFCPQHVDETASEYDNQLVTAVHEIVHALGFSSSRYAYFWDTLSGQPRTVRAAANAFYVSGKPNLGSIDTFPDASGYQIFKPADTTLKQYTERGNNVWKIRTPAALGFARERFGCTTLNGVELESQGGSGTAGSHWDARVYAYDMMAPAISAHCVFDKLTLGYLFDTGWYWPDYTKASTSLWGKGQGCAFAMDKCLTPVAGGPPTSQFGEWCTAAPNTRFGCDFMRTGKANCNTATYNGDLPVSFRYFTLNSRMGGIDSHSDYCPYMAAYSNRICAHGVNQPAASTNWYGDYYGSLDGYQSRCFESTLYPDGYVASGFTANAGCYIQKCEASQMKLWVACTGGSPSGCPVAGGAWVVCPTVGGPIAPPATLGFHSSGRIVCPSFQSACQGPFTGFGAPPGATASPTAVPTNAPVPAGTPTATPTTATPTAAPTTYPTRAPTSPTAAPTATPTAPTAAPTNTPTNFPTVSFHICAHASCCCLTRMCVHGAEHTYRAPNTSPNTYAGACYDLHDVGWNNPSTVYSDYQSPLPAGHRYHVGRSCVVDSHFLICPQERISYLRCADPEQYRRQQRCQQHHCKHRVF